ncbi:MAG: hypothetical protein GY724_13275 [Actinomycetia bacterium]|nr:hypothetical protein [Actinomycetes bacterium]MCP4226334.1 hypothetical protein [Actinomycetes bacterium]MCP5035556.1 hypothetical protein [Actinomycetes bacterium]
MDNPPPRWFRRLLMTPLVFVGAVILALVAPVILLIAAVIDLVIDRKRLRVSRFVGVGLAFCVVEVYGLFALLTVWIGSGFGLFMGRRFWVRANTVLLGQYLALITRAIRLCLGFSFFPSSDRVGAGRQLLLPRHAGPGDAFLIARVVVRDFGRRIHMVGAAKLQWDPFLDISGERLGFHYVAANPSDRAAELERIRQLSSSLEADETLVIFPEGGNYTTGRRVESIKALEERGNHEQAARARRLKHTLLPKTGGLTAAIDGAPDAIVVFVAHAGLEQLHGFGDLWASVPLNRTVRAHGWSVPINDRPSDRASQANWLFDHWQTVDDWIESNIDYEQIQTVEAQAQAADRAQTPRGLGSSSAEPSVPY